MDNLNLFIKSIFVDNMVFAYFLGMCSFLAVSKNVKTAFGLGVAVSFVLMIALPITWCINQYLLVPGALSWLGQEYAETDLSFLGLIMFIAVIAALVQILEMVIEKYSPSLYNSLGIFLPLIAVNCAILGAVLFMQQREFDNAWRRLRHRLATCHHSACGHTRTPERKAHPGAPARSGYLVYHHRTYGHSLYVVLRH